MKIIKILLILGVVLVLVAAAGLFLINRYVQSADFKETTLALARQTVGSRMELGDMDVSLFSGVALRQIKIANPQGFAGKLLEADAFTLRYRLWPLLRRQVVISELALEAPTIHLVQDEQGTWNYEKLGGETAAADPSGGGGGGKQIGGLGVTLEQIALNGGVVEMRSQSDKLLVRLEGVDLTSTASLQDNQFQGAGEVKIGLLNLADSLFARDLGAPVMLSSAAVSLDPLRGTLAEGELGAAIHLQLAGGTRYEVSLAVTGANVATLIAEAGQRAVMTGRLALQTKLNGTGGLETIDGSGHAQINEGKLTGIPLLKLLATLLQIPELQELAFSECLMDFTIANNVMQTPRIRLVAPQLELSGHGQVALTDYSLDHTFTLAVQPDLLAKLPKEVRAVFVAREDGSLTLEFHVTGPYDAPQTDLKQKLLQGTTEQLIQKGLQKLFK